MLLMTRTANAKIDEKKKKTTNKPKTLKLKTNLYQFIKTAFPDCYLNKITLSNLKF